MRPEVPQLKGEEQGAPLRPQASGLRPRFWRSVRRDIRVALEQDPAAHSALEVVLAYPGFHARQIHRLAHRLYRWRLRLLARLVSHGGRWLTGIEIHPGAQIGEGLFIDHGMAVVIGETTIIGDDVVLHQGVTLGGTSRQRVKRHPTLGNGVVVGANASIIGAITIGENVSVGAGSVVVRSVPPNATVVGVPGRVVAIRNPDNDTVQRLPDPEWELLQELRERVAALEARLAAAERHDHDHEHALPLPTPQDLWEIDGDGVMTPPPSQPTGRRR